MIKILNTEIDTNKTEEIQDFKKGSWINMIAPTDEERAKVYAL